MQFRSGLAFQFQRKFIAMSFFTDNYYYSFKIVYILSVLFGTLPVLSDAPNEEKVNIWRKTCCILWIFLTIGNHVYYVIQSFASPNSGIVSTTGTKVKKYDVIVGKLIVAENWTFNIATVVNICTVFRAQIHAGKIFANLQQVEGWISNIMGSEESHRMKKNELKIVLYLTISCYALIFTTMLLEYSEILSVQRRADFANTLVRDMEKLCLVTFDLQFATLCVLLKSRFEVINKILKSFRADYFPTRNRTISAQADMVQVNKNHAKLCDTIDLMKSMYQIQVTLNLGVCFFNTVCVLFITISEYRANTRWILWISGLLWVTFYVFRVVMICSMAELTIKKATKSRMLLSYINDRNLESEKKRSVERFLRRLAHTEIKFDMCGLVTINASLLSTAAVGVTTYLVIALQYSYS